MRPRHAAWLAGGAILLLMFIVLPAPVLADKGDTHDEHAGKAERAHDRHPPLLSLTQLLGPRAASAPAAPEPVPLPRAPTPVSAPPIRAPAAPGPMPRTGTVPETGAIPLGPPAPVEPAVPSVAEGFGTALLAAGKHVLVIGGVGLFTLVLFSIGSRRRA
ncbi:MAG: hypothetical protein LC624_05400 [Halobacteriales archaeon]|nr:hypothetical protein [Halobacteriales archaeon]